MATDESRQAYVLVVDDVESIAMVLRRIIEKMGFRTNWAGGVSEAAELIGVELPDIIITDITMPHIDGFEFLRILKNNVVTKDIPVIVISGLDSNEEKQKAIELGAVDFIIKPFNQIEVKNSISTHLKIRRMQIELEEYNKKLNIMVEQQRKQIEFEQKNILVALANVIEIQVEADGASHLKNVSYNSKMLAQSLCLTEKYEDYISQDYIETIETASLLHDIGKIKGCEDVEEEAQDEFHSERGAAILEGIYAACKENRFLNMAIKIARYHHMPFKSDDPFAVQGDELPLSSRIVHIISDYDKYKNGITSSKFSSTEEIIERMKQDVGIKYDPQIFEVFLKILNQLK